MTSFTPMFSFQGQTDAGYFDLNIAFEFFSHELFLYNLIVSAFRNSYGYVKWFCNYLSNRKSQVSNSGILSLPL
jgi:hypothetical protein